MFENHANREKYFNEQALNTKKYIIPFLSQKLEIKPGIKVLEIGCGEGGNLKPFIEAGCCVTGIDLTESKIKNASRFYPGWEQNQSIRFIHGDIYDYSHQFASAFDLILLKDTLEHIPNHQKLLEAIKNMLKKSGVVFIAFPPWEMPFGGHQQMCYSKVLSLMPWIHLLPRFAYKGLLKAFGEPDFRIRELFEVRDTRISIGRFEKICKKLQLKTQNVDFYFINPNYQIKFGIKPRKLFKPFSRIPFIRNFITTTCYYLLSADEKM